MANAAFLRIVFGVIIGWFKFRVFEY